MSNPPYGYQPNQGFQPQGGFPGPDAYGRPQQSAPQGGVSGRSQDVSRPGDAERFPYGLPPEVVAQRRAEAASGAPQSQPSAGYAPSQGPGPQYSTQTPYGARSVGAPYAQPMGAPYSQPSAPAPYNQPSAPAPYGQPSTPDPYGRPSAPAPYGQPSGPYGQPYASAPAAQQPAASPYAEQTAPTPYAANDPAPSSQPSAAIPETPVPEPPAPQSAPDDEHPAPAPYVAPHVDRQPAGERSTYAPVAQTSYPTYSSEPQPVPSPSSAGQTNLQPREDMDRGVPAGAWTVELDDGRTIEIGRLTLLGRNPQPRPGEDAALVTVTDEARKISKTHLALGVDERGLYLCDRGSTNGTAIENAPDDYRPCPEGELVRLVDGQKISYGDRSFVIRKKA